MYVLNLAEDKRILSIWDKIEGQDYGDMPIVEKRPEDLVPKDATNEEKDCNNYLYTNGEYIYKPLEPEPEPEIESEPTADEILNALLGVV